MKRSAFVQRLLGTAVCLVVAASLLSIALPHHHHGAASSQHSETCRLCKIQEGFSAAPAALRLIQHALRLVAFHPLSAREVPRTCLLVRLSAPRAPPVLS